MRRHIPRFCFAQCVFPDMTALSTCYTAFGDMELPVVNGTRSRISAWLCTHDNCRLAETRVK